MMLEYKKLYKIYDATPVTMCKTMPSFSLLFIGKFTF